LVLHGDHPLRLRAIGAEALEEIERLEARLSLFRPTSEIAHLNARAAFEPVRVTPALFALLQHAQRLHAETAGAFDITIAPLVRCWGFMGGSGRVPGPEELAQARANVGMSLVHLEPKNLTVYFAREGVMLDLGAIGKGYAVERAAELLREAGVTSALLHGGTSTVYAVGHPPDADFWQVEVENREPPLAPASPSRSLSSSSPAGPPAQTQASQPEPFAVVNLKDESLSVSGIRGKWFEAEGRPLGHIIDPRTGRPALNAVLAAVVLPSATETDALSTALLTLGPEGHEQIAGLRPAMRTLVVSRSGGQFHLASRGLAASN
jgi:thiamine biosynthesis lipoprotein